MLFFQFLAIIILFKTLTTFCTEYEDENWMMYELAFVHMRMLD